MMIERARPKAAHADPFASTLHFLSALDLFRDLVTAEEIEECDEAIQVMNCKAGYVFYTPGQTGEVHDSFAEAISDSHICTMRRSDVERLILSRPRVGLRLLEALGQRMVELERRLEEVTFKGLIPRIATLLLNEARGAEIAGLTHQDIADRLGIYRETATNALNQLKSFGIIEIGRRRIGILDRGRLERTAAERGRRHLLDFVDGQWLADVIVHPGRETSLAIARHRIGRQCNDRNPATTAAN